MRSCGECDFGEWGPGDDVCHPCPEGFSTVNTSSTKEKDCLGKLHYILKYCWRSPQCHCKASGAENVFARLLALL